MWWLEPSELVSGGVFETAGVALAVLYINYAFYGAPGSRASKPPHEAATAGSASAQRR